MTGFGAQYVPVGATASAIILRQAALLGLIAARTGLAPRTLAKSLKSKPKPARATNRSTNAIVLLVVALVVAGAAAADFLLPMTPLTWVNWVSVGSLAFLTLCLIFASLRAALAPRTLPAHASSPSVGAPVPNVPGVSYVLSWRTAPLTRLLLFIIGLFLAFNLIPGAWALFMLFTPFLPGHETQLLSESAFAMLGRYLLAFALAIFGVIGLGLAFVGARAATTSIRADKDGLTTRTGPSEQLMAWSSVQDISWGLGAGGKFAYLVKSDVPTLQISWVAGLQPSAIPPSDGAIPIGPDELAALVAARTGKSIRVRDDAS